MDITHRERLELWKDLSTIEESIDTEEVVIEQLSLIEAIAVALELPVRYFLELPYSCDADIEITRDEFLATEGSIGYTRHTVFANGVSQVCLTKQ